MNLVNIAQARFNMIEQQIRPWNVLDADVLNLLADVRREEFVPLAHQALAFADLEIPLGHGQCMLAPRLEARMLQDLQIQPHEKALEIGTGSGYMAALLAHRAQHVVTLEIDPALARAARQNLQKAGIHNAEVLQLDGASLLITGEADQAGLSGPFDVIVLSGSVAQVPTELLALLKTGGRLIAIVGDEPVMRASLSTRVDAHAMSHTAAWDTLAPRLLNFPTPSAFRF